MQGKLAVNGVAGAQGFAIAAHLCHLGHDVIGLSRAAFSSGTQAGFDWRVSDLDDGQLSAALEGVDTLVFTYPIAFDFAQAERRVATLISACAAQDVKHVIFNTSVPLGDRETGVRAIDIKRSIADQFRQSSLRTTVIEPTLYLGNLLAPWSVEAIRATQTIVYPLPANLKVSWTIWEDIAVAVDQILTGKLTADVVKLGVRPALSGAELAAEFTDVRSLDHTYVALGLADFEAGLTAAMGPEVAAELGRLYAWLANEGSADLAASTSPSLPLVPVTSWIAQQNWS